MKLRTDRNASAGMRIILVFVVVAVVIIAGMFAWAWAARAAAYANDPSTPPDEVEDQVDNPPDWMCKFKIDVRVDFGWVGSAVSDVDIEDMRTNLEKYEGEPWGTQWGGLQWFQKPDSVTVEYELSLNKGRTTVPPDGPDKGSFKVYKDDDYEATGTSDWFFWWEELSGNWAYTLQVTCDGETDTVTGTFGYFDDGRSVVN